MGFNEYIQEGRRKVIKFKTKDDFSLDVVFDNGVCKNYQMQDKLMGVLAVLKDQNKFKQAFIDEQYGIAWDIDSDIDSNIVWSNRINLCRDALYINGNIINID